MVLDWMKEDPAIKVYKGVYNIIMKYLPALYYNVDPSAEKASKNFAAALMEWQKGKAMYPDANSTMRLTYGHVLPYSPKDALKYAIEGWLRQITTSASLTTGEPIASSEITTEQFAVPPRISGPYEGNQETSLPS